MIKEDNIQEELGTTGRLALHLHLFPFEIIGLSTLRNTRWRYFINVLVASHCLSKTRKKSLFAGDTSMRLVLICFCVESKE